MVVLHVKRGDESQFLLQAPGSTELEELTAQVTRVYNGRLKVHRLCTGAEREDGGRGGSARGCEDSGRFAVAWGGKGASGLTRDEKPTTGETQTSLPPDSEESSGEAKYGRDRIWASRKCGRTGSRGRVTEQKDPAQQWELARMRVEW